MKNSAKKNNTGFTLIGMLIIGAFLAALAAAGIAYMNYRSKSINADQTTSNGNQLQVNINNMAAGTGSISKTESMQFDSTLATPTP